METANIGLDSSAGRAPARQSGGHRFKSRSSKFFFVHPNLLKKSLRFQGCWLFEHATTKQASRQRAQACMRRCGVCACGSIDLNFRFWIYCARHAQIYDSYIVPFGKNLNVSTVMWASTWDEAYIFGRHVIKSGEFAYLWLPYDAEMSVTSTHKTCCAQYANRTCAGVLSFLFYTQNLLSNDAQPS